MWPVQAAFGLRIMASVFLRLWQWLAAVPALLLWVEPGSYARRRPEFRKFPSTSKRYFMPRRRTWLWSMGTSCSSPEAQPRPRPIALRKRRSPCPPLWRSLRFVLRTCGVDAPSRQFHEPRFRASQASALNAQLFQHSDVVARRFLPGKFVDDVLPPAGSHLSSVVGVIRQVEDRFHQSLTVLGFHEDAGAGFFDNLASLTVDSDNHRPLARHVFEQLSRNHGLEQLSLFQHDQANIGSRDIGGNPFPRLLTKELNVGQSARSGEFYDSIFFCSFPNQ